MPRFARSGDVLASDDQCLCCVRSRQQKCQKDDDRSQNSLHPQHLNIFPTYSLAGIICQQFVKSRFLEKSVSLLRLSRSLPIKLPPRLFGRNISRMQIREIFQFLSLLEDRYLQPLQICQREALNPELQMSIIKLFVPLEFTSPAALQGRLSTLRDTILSTLEGGRL